MQEVPVDVARPCALCLEDAAPMHSLQPPAAASDPALLGFNEKRALFEERCSQGCVRSDELVRSFDASRVCGEGRNVVNVSFIDGASCAFGFSEEFVFEQALRERVYAHFSLLECEVDLVFAQGASVLDMGDVVDAARAVVAVKRSVEEAADCGGPAAHPCRFRPCCQHHRCFKALKVQCVALAARRRRLEASLWAKWRELPSRKRCSRGKLETRVKLLRRV